MSNHDGPPTPPSFKQEWWQQTKYAVPVAIACTLFLVLLVSIGRVDSQPEETPTNNSTEESVEAPEAPTPPEPEQTPRVAHGEYGSDPYFDRLYDECAEGRQQACNDLFWESPLDSEYEQFALDQGVDTDIGGNTDETLLNLMWDGFSQRERNDACESYNFLGSRPAYNAFVEGAGEQIVEYNSFRNFFDEHC